MQALQEQLASIAALADQKQKLEQYKELLQQLLAPAAEDTAKLFIDHMLSDDVPLVVSRQVLQLFAQGFSGIPLALQKPIAAYALEKIQPREVSFKEQVTVLRENLATVLEAEEEWTKAAQVLAGIDLESGNRVVEPLYKLSTNVRIAMLYLQDEDPVNAEVYIKKASALIGNSKSEELELQYKTCYARIMDSKRRFLDAAMRYYELSSIEHRSIGGKTINEEDLEQALSSAIRCTILAAAGPQRSRILSTLYKDERSSALPVYPFLEKVYLERILHRKEVDAFARTLQPHQLAQLSDGTTVLDRAVTQHNLLSASKLYSNVTIEELGTLLGVAPGRAETIAADMISDGRLAGSIDQVEMLIRFDDKLEPLLQWDHQIQSVCQKVNDIIDMASCLKAG